MLELAMIFSDSMVLQREKPIHIWGKDTPKSRVSVTLIGDKVSACTDQCGNWHIVLPEKKAATDLILTVCDDDGDKITLKDICIGEVWIAGGQSNMEFPLAYDVHFETEIINQERNPRIRFFDYPEVAYEGELNDREYKNEGFWRGCTAEDLGYFSAVGFYFAKNLQEAIDVPVGIVGCNWAGTPACAWMDSNYLKGTEGEVWVKDYESEFANINFDDFIEKYKVSPFTDRTNNVDNPFNIQMVKIGAADERENPMDEVELDSSMFQLFKFEQRPGGLYETMLKKIVPFAARGVIWYQGETDGDSHAKEYTTVFSKMIENWRALWGEELPFLFVQLAPFEKWAECYGENYIQVRDCQEEVSKNVSNCWMAAIGDVGMQWDIHPKNKRPVGDRLALLARGHVYGENIVCDAPEVIDVVKKGDDIVIRFANAEGLFIKGDRLQAMNLNSKTQDSIAVDAEVLNDTLILHSVGDVTEIRFAKEPYHEVNLYNSSEIPAKPFVFKL
ncbi:MAG: sialate O-acetylesterase [Hespellia sp.]|nr:sialate O-acetylesterase [Hespellia sp.]